MADYLDRLLGPSVTETLSAILFLHENPQDFIEHWRRGAHCRQYHLPAWKRLEEDGFIKFTHSKVQRKAKAIYTLADENVTWLLISVLELILRKVERQRSDVRSMLRYAAMGPDRGTFEQTMSLKEGYGQGVRNDIS